MRPDKSGTSLGVFGVRPSQRPVRLAESDRAQHRRGSLARRARIGSCQARDESLRIVNAEVFAHPLVGLTVKCLGFGMTVLPRQEHGENTLVVEGFRVVVSEGTAVAFVDLTIQCLRLGQAALLLDG